MSAYYYYSHLTDRQIEGINYLAKVMWQSWKSNQGQSDFRASYETPYYSIFHVSFFSSLGHPINSPSSHVEWLSLFCINQKAETQSRFVHL